MISQTVLAPHSKRFNGTIRKARALRKIQTPAEKLLWKKLRGRKFHDLKFRRQVPIGSFIVDFYCAECRLIIEIDGSIHAFKEEYDDNRQQFIEERGYTVLRFTNRQIKESMTLVLACIASAMEARHPSPIRWERDAPRGAG